MKLFFSLIIIFISANSYAIYININYENEITKAIIVQEIFKKKYFIPNELIKLKNLGCEEIKHNSRNLELCITKKGELKILSSNIKFKIISLSIFK